MGSVHYPPGDGAPPWIDWALRELGRNVVEIPGPRHNARVLYYFGFTRYHAKADEIAWCSAFVCAALENAGVRSSRSARASSYREWGIPCELKDGAVCFFPPADPDAGGSGHVGFYWRGQLLGGNQRNRVSLADRDFTTVAAIRWPHF